MALDSPIVYYKVCKEVLQQAPLLCCGILYCITDEHQVQTRRGCSSTLSYFSILLLYLNGVIYT